MIDRIKTLRVTFFKTQQAFADFLGISNQAAATYEKGKAIIPTEKIIKLVRELNISPLWLLTGKGNMLLTEQDNISEQQKIDELSAKVQKLEIENALLKELIKK